MKRLRIWRDERGVGEALTAIIVLPFMMAVIFNLIEVGLNLQWRAQVETITRDAARGVSMEGSNFNSNGTVLPPEYGVETSGLIGWEKWGTAALQDLCDRDNGARCDDALGKPRMECFPAGLATSAGEQVGCTAFFPYKPVAPFTATNPLFSLGFSPMWDDGITIEVTTRTAVLPE